MLSYCERQENKGPLSTEANSNNSAKRKHNQRKRERERSLMIRYRQGGWLDVHSSTAVYSALKGKVKRKCFRKRKMHLRGQIAAWNELRYARIRRGLLSIVIAAEEVDKCPPRPARLSFEVFGWHQWRALRMLWDDVACRAAAYGKQKVGQSVFVGTPQLYATIAVSANKILAFLSLWVNCSVNWVSAMMTQRPCRYVYEYAQDFIFDICA